MDRAAAQTAKDEALAALRLGNTQGALAAAERAVAADDGYAEAWAARGTARLMMNDPAAAEADLTRAVTLNPGLAGAHLNRAMALIALQRVDDAEQALVHATNADPSIPVDTPFKRLVESRRAAFAETQAPGDGIRLALLYRMAGLLAEAEAVLSDCLRRAPDDGELWMVMGDLMLLQRRFDAAEDAARHAASLRPDDPEAAINIAGVQAEGGNRARAIASARFAAATFPQSCRAWLQLADLLRDDFVEGWDALSNAARSADATNAALSRAMWAAAERADWTAGETLLEQLAPRLAADAVNPLRLMLPLLDPALIRDNAALYSTTNYPARRALARPASPKTKLKIGYLSPDFRDHPVGAAIVDVLRAHDRTRFEVHAYAIGADANDAQRQAIVAACDSFTNLADLSDHRAAHRIQGDGIDILIDLAGHTLNSRLGILSFRPAPLQIHYLGYPGTLGASFIDYIVGDPWVAAAPEHFTEAVIRLPHTYLATPARAAAATGWDRARFGFAETDVVLCCFNHPHKITKHLFDAWARILRAVPETVLWLRADNPVAIENLRKEAEARGVAPDRVHFAPRVAMDVHLARYGVADLMLDTAPYNAHTTAADALWMRCPVLTVPGESFAARVCAGLLCAIGRDDLIAADLDDYTERATRLARDAQSRATLRASLANVRGSVLFDSASFTRSFELGLLAAWDRATSGLAPATIDIKG